MAKIDRYICTVHCEVKRQPAQLTLELLLEDGDDPSIEIAKATDRLYQERIRIEENNYYQPIGG